MEVFRELYRFSHRPFGRTSALCSLWWPWSGQTLPVWPWRGLPKPPTQSKSPGPLRQIGCVVSTHNAEYRFYQPTVTILAWIMLNTVPRRPQGENPSLTGECARRREVKVPGVLIDRKLHHRGGRHYRCAEKGKVCLHHKGEFSLSASTVYAKRAVKYHLTAIFTIAGGPSHF